MALDFGVTYLCKELLRINKYVANSLGFSLAATSNYLFNRMWTFASADPRVVRQYLYFLTISLIGLALNNFTIWLLNGKCAINFSRILKQYILAEVDDATINFYCAKLIAVLCIVMWNFVMNYIFTF
jgi:putative flippase GtrA